MFTLDPDLQRADLGVAEATVANAKQAFDRAQQLMKSGSGTQKDFDVTQALFRQAQAQLAAAQTRLMRRKVLSPVDGLIQQSISGPAKPCRPSRPIMALLPPGNIKVRFFVPEPMLARIAIDDEVRLTCDGCPADLTGKITFISRNAEFTPPVIYSQQERHKLVYLVEAMPARSEVLRVGQPVDVVVTPASGTTLRQRSAGDVPASKAPANDGEPEMASVPDIAIDVHGLTKSFGGRVVVRDLSMQVKRGTIYGFLGPNGSGKTTTIRMLSGLLTPDKGEGTCLGYDIRTQADEIKLHVGYMTQRFSLYQDLSVRGESGIRRAALPHEQSGAGGARDDRAARAQRPRRATWRANSPAAGSSGSRSAPAPCRTRSCFCSTSRPPASIRKRGANSGTRSMRSRPTA